MNAEITEDQFCEYIVDKLKKYAWRLVREGKLSWIDRSYNSNFAVVKNHATCDTSLTKKRQNNLSDIRIHERASRQMG